MGRAIVREPKAFLMDEPLSNLDAKLRVSMRAELAKLHERLGVTTVYVTHDQVEAMTLGQRVAVLRDGAAAAGRHAAEPLPPPGEPVRRCVHRLAVDEPRRRAGRERHASRSPAIELALPGVVAASRGVERAVILGIRPTDFEHAATRGPATCRACASGRTSSRISARRCHVIFTDRRARASTAEAVRAASRHARTRASSSPTTGAVFTACIDARQRASHAAPSSSSRSTTGSLHFFDPGTGLALGAG